MAINGLSGKPGGGKSYEAVKNHIIPTVTVDKRKVVTNIPLNVDHFCAVYGEYCRELIDVIDGKFHSYGEDRPFSKKDHFLQYEDWQNEKGQKTYFFIDECHLAMPMNGTEKELTEFFSMHRHYGFDVMLITQNFRKVNRDIRDMVQIGYRAIKKSMLGRDDAYILKVHDGASSSNQSVVNTFERVYESKIFPFYTSHTKNNSSVEEATTKDVRPWWKHWTILGCIPLFFFAFVLAVSASSDKKTNVPTKKVVPIKTNEVVSAPLGSPVATAPLPRMPEKTQEQQNYEQMVNESDDFHPFYKVQLSVDGFAEYTDGNKRVRKQYIGASQNGQRIFTITTGDLMLAGYDVQVLGVCSIKIKFFKYVEYLTCSLPKIGVSTVGNND